MTQKKIVVVGAGISGLTCAYELQKAGHAVVVYEKEPHVGGRMWSRERNHLLFDIGADHLCNLYTEMRQYCATFNIPWEKMRFLSYRVVRGGHVVPLEQGVAKKTSQWRLAWEFVKTRKRELDFFDLSTAVQHDVIDAYSYIKNQTDQDVADYMVDPFSSTYQFHSAREISLSAHKAIMESIKYQKPLWYLHRTKGGMRALPQAFADQLDVRTNTPVTRVVGGPSVTLTADRQETADAIVLACPATTTKKIYTNPTEQQSMVFNGTTYASSISIAFIVDQSLIPEDVGIVWVPMVENTTISGYVNEKMKGEDVCNNGKTLLSVWLHDAAAKKLLHQTNEEIIAAIIPELKKICPWIKNDTPLAYHDLQRWAEAMPKFSHGHITKVHAFMQHGQGEQNVFFSGDYLNSPWTEGALRCGQRVAEQVMKQLGAHE